MRLSEVLVSLSDARLRALAEALGTPGLEDAPMAVVTEVILDRLAARPDAVGWVLGMLPAVEREALMSRQV